MTEAAPAPAPAAAFAPLRAPGIGPDGSYTRRGQIVAFAVGLLAMFGFFPGLIAGAVLYTRAEERYDRDPGSARKLVRWSWLSLALSALPGAALVIGGVAMLLAG